MNRTDFANAPRNKKLSLTDEYRGTFDLKNYAVQYDLVGQMLKKGFRKRIVISTDNGYLGIYARDLITYLKNHKFRLLPRLVLVRIAECLSPVLIRVGSSLTTKFVITEDAKRAYCNGDEKLYDELSDF